MKATMGWESYNKRRYGWPWAAKITAFDGAPTLDFIKGAYNGNENGGEMVITAEVGEVVKIWQKDHRGNGTMNAFYLVTESGDLERIDSPAEARELWTKHKEGK